MLRKCPLTPQKPGPRICRLSPHELARRPELADEVEYRSLSVSPVYGQDFSLKREMIPTVVYGTEFSLYHHVQAIAAADHKNHAGATQVCPVGDDIIKVEHPEDNRRRINTEAPEENKRLIKVEHSDNNKDYKEVRKTRESQSGEDSGEKLDDSDMCDDEDSEDSSNEEDFPDLWGDSDMYGSDINISALLEEILGG